MITQNFSEILVDTVKEEIILCPEYVDQASLAQKLEMSRETLCRKINDPAKMSIDELSKIAVALGKSLHFYFE